MNPAFLGKFRLVSSVNHGFATDPQDSILDDEAPAYNSGNDAPFKPFRIRLSNGGAIDMLEPGSVIVGESSAVLPVEVAIDINSREHGRKRKPA